MFPRNEFEIALRVNPTNHGFDEYSRRMRFSEEDLAGKTILDLGSGFAQFATDVVDLFTGRHDSPDIALFDPVYVAGNPGFDDYERKRFEERLRFLKEHYPQLYQNMQGGVISDLPFGDESFDLVLAHQVFRYIVGPFAFERSLNEAVRVVRPGGEARIAPFEFTNNTDWVNGWVHYDKNPEVFDAIFERLRRKHNLVDIDIYRSSPGYLTKSDVIIKKAA